MLDRLHEFFSLDNTYQSKMLSSEVKCIRMYKNQKFNLWQRSEPSGYINVPELLEDNQPILFDHAFFYKCSDDLVVKKIGRMLDSDFEILA